MALSDTTESSDKKPDGNKASERKEKLLTKVIIRRLPPNMSQDTFLNQISPVPCYDYLYMVKGDASLGEYSFSRAYINFTNPNDVYDFKEKFDNYVFLDAAGHEYPAIVEFAAFQKIPKKRNKVRVDPKIGSIESDPYYLEFVEMLNKPPEQDEKPEYSYQITTENKNETSTPLLEYVKHKRAEKLRIREEKREERKRKDFERKKFREDERKKRFDEKSPVKSSKSPYTKVASPKEKAEPEGDKPEVETTGDKLKPDEKLIEKEDGEKSEKSPSTSSYYKNRERKYEDRKKEIKSKYPSKKEYVDKREFKNRRDDYKDRDYNRSKYNDDYKKDDSKSYQKKVKKYSEKREERKMEAQKAEQKKLEQQTKEQDLPSKSTSAEIAKTSPIIEEKPKDSPSKRRDDKDNETEKDAGGSRTKLSERHRDSEAQSQKRIRNKDRPTIAIYRPGMLSKRKQTDGDTDNKDGKKE